MFEITAFVDPTLLRELKESQVLDCLHSVSSTYQPGMLKTKSNSLILRIDHVQVMQLADQWLKALQIAQIASDR